jgi:uncharacterized protein with PQ loop repeat
LNRFFTVRRILIGLGIALLDFLVYGILSLLLIHYDDFSAQSEHYVMTTTDRVAASGIIVWNIINILASIFLIYKVILALKVKKMS